MKRLVYLLIFSFSCTLIGQAQLALGDWQDHLSYSNVSSITSAGSTIYAASGEGLFSYNQNSGELKRFSKSNGLSDVGVSALNYSDEMSAVIVGYSNGNIDVLNSNGIQNISDIKRSSIIGDRGIYDIAFKGDEVWLGTGFGIVVLDILELEVVDTYILSVDGSNSRVNDIAFLGNEVYAATEMGIRFANLNFNLADFMSWSNVSSIPNPTAEFDLIENFNGTLVTHAAGTVDDVYAQIGGLWTPTASVQGLQAVGFSSTTSNLLVVTRHGYKVLDTNFFTSEEVNTTEFQSFLYLNTGQLMEDGTVAIGNDDFGLLLFADEAVDYYFPKGPNSDSSWQLEAANGHLWIAHGKLQSNWDNIFNQEGYSGLLESEWKLGVDEPVFEEVRDLIDVKVNPFSPNEINFASFKGGLVVLNLNTGEHVAYNEFLGNSNLAASTLNPERIQVAGLAFDINGNLWMSNSYTSEPFKVRMKNGEWKAFDCEADISLIGELIVTEQGQTWGVLPRGSGLVVYQHNNDLSSTANHDCKRFGTGVGNGALPTTTVFTVAEDLDGEIWVGTSEGPVVNYSPLSVLTNNPVDFQSILVERDGNVERLLGTESITSIAIDGANRKWLGTLTGGVYLLSDDGTEEVQHFTESNSPLLSNNIKDIAIDGSTGAVHIATDKGTVTYMGDSTQGGEENECYDVYPNPVRPEYRGPITIDGLVRDSEVKITDVAGNIVYQSISNGGRVVWEGTDFSGNRVSTGVYFALVADREASTTCISKILFIN